MRNRIRNMQKPTKRRQIRRIAVAVMLALILGIGGFAVYLYVKADQAISRIAAPADPTASHTNSAQPGATAESSQEPEDEDPLRPQLILLAGIDNRQGSDGTLNTDALILCAFNPRTRTASMLSLPRDLRVKAENGVSRKANYFYAHYYLKDKETAISETKRFFAERLQLPIDYMAVVNFDALRQTVDSLGGLEIDVDMDMKYYDSADGTKINLKKGLQKLNGQHTLDFVRYRKSNQGTRESSDFARNERQQMVIKQIADKLGSFQGITQWGNVLDIIGNNVRSDIPESELRSWIASFREIKPDVIRSVKMDAEWASPFAYVKEENWRQAVEALRQVLGLTSQTSDYPNRPEWVVP